MSQRLFPYTISLAFIYVLAFSPQIHAQSPLNSARCSSPLSLTSDDQAELIGKKVRAKVIVDSVVFDGPTSLPSSIREELIADLKKHAALSSGSEWLEEWNEVAVRGAWMDEGFFKMTSTAKAQTISSDATEQHVSVTVHVDEGMQYRLKDVRFRKSPDDWPVQNDEASEDEAANGKPSLRKKVALDDAEQLGFGEPIFAPEELRKRVPLVDGGLFSTSQIREGLDALKELYGSYGYINLVAVPITEVDDRSGMISLILELDEGKPFRIRSVEVQGLNLQTKAALNWRIQAGDLFDYELFKDFFTDNKDILPSDASPSNAELHKDEKNGTVDIRFVFPSCP
jgi:outer membrane protein assembly factor BamA